MVRIIRPLLTTELHFARPLVSVKMALSTVVDLGLSRKVHRGAHGLKTEKWQSFDSIQYMDSLRCFSWRSAKCYWWFWKWSRFKKKNWKNLNFEKFRKLGNKRSCNRLQRRFDWFASCSCYGFRSARNLYFSTFSEKFQWFDIKAEKGDKIDNPFDGVTPNQPDSNDQTDSTGKLLSFFFWG